MANPLVSIIVLCYNQASFVENAILSALHQTYNSVELFVVDDCSSDSSTQLIKKLAGQYSFKTIFNTENLGNCRSFNKAFKESKGEYIIDLAADDILLPERVKVGVDVMENLSDEFAVHYCDAEIITEGGSFQKTHFKRNNRGKLTEKVPEGWIFKDLVERFVICTPTMMIKRNVLERLGGYDETLTYEDFDFWVRSSREFKYAFSDQILVKKRKVKKSLSTRQKILGNKHLYSTAQVCQKAFDLCWEKEEFIALQKRVHYEAKWAAMTGNFKALKLLLTLMRRINKRDFD